MKKTSLVFLLGLLFFSCITFARTDRYDADVYNTCVTNLRTYVHNAEATAGRSGLGLSKRGMEYLSSLPTEDEIQQACEYEADNWEDTTCWNMNHNFALTYAQSDNYEKALEYLNEAIYCVPIGSDVYNATYKEIQDAKAILAAEKSQEQFNNWSYYFKLATSNVANYQFDSAITNLEKALEYTDYGSQEYYDTQTMLQKAKDLKKQQNQLNSNNTTTNTNSSTSKSTIQANYEKRDNYYQQAIKAMDNYNYDDAIYYLEKSLDYSPDTENYNNTKSLIEKIRNEVNKDKTTTTVKQNTIPNDVLKAKEELGNKAAIFDSLVPLFKKKDQKTQNNVKTLLKTFTQSKDAYTRNIGIYFGYLVE